MPRHTVRIMPGMHLATTGEKRPMNKRKTDPDPNAAGYASHTPKDGPPLPDQQSAEDEAMDFHNENELPAGTQTGQTARGSYGTNTSTGAGTYMDHSAVFSGKPVAQPGTDEELEPDAVDPKI